MAGETTSSRFDKAGGKLDPFHPEMPQIPGLSDARRRGARQANLDNLKRFARSAGVIVAASLVGIAVVWGGFKALRHIAEFRAASPTPVQVSRQIPSASDSIPPVADIMGPTHVAAFAQLSKPWAAKKFQFVKAFTRESVDAMAIRLPGGALWAFALQEPYGQCELEFVTNLQQLETQYGYRATHPMIVSPCDKVVYDPLKVGSAGGDVWARGAIVKGEGLRPPFAIDVRQSGRNIIATRME